MERIDQAKLEAMLADPDVPDAAIRPYLMLDTLETTSLRPVVIINPAMVVQSPLEAAMGLGALNGIARARRHQRYARKIRGWTGLKAVAEGDSWFQYPLLLDDVIDHLFDRWAIFCLSGAGDLLRDMARQDEVTAAVLSEKPDLLLLSGGGNDVLGGGNLRTHLHPHRPGMTAEAHVAPGFDTLLSATLATYGQLIEKSLQAGAKRIVCHSYDYAIPNGGRWLGRPMIELGITDPALQRAILTILIDRFHAGLSRLARRFGGRVVVADTRRSVGAGSWHDELHPTSAGYGRPAAIIRRAAESAGLEGVSVPAERVPGPGPLEAEAPPPETPEPRPLPVGDERAVEALLAASPEALLDEIGRRQAVLEFSPEAAGGMVLELPPPGLESIGSNFRDLGARLVSRQLRELHRLMCGGTAETEAERSRLRNALGLSDAAMVGAFSSALIAVACPAYVAPLIAATIVKWGVNPLWEETCNWWGEKLAAE